MPILAQNTRTITHNGQTRCYTAALVTPSISATTRSTHSAHRSAFGPGKYRTPEQKAADVARSIALRTDAGDAWTWATYGLEGNWAQQKLVEAALAKLQWTAEEEAKLQAWYWEQEQERLEAWEALQDLEVHGRW